MENRNKPAYPQPIAECNGGLSETIDYNPDSSGLTKREKIAAMILQGLVSNSQLINMRTASDKEWREDISITASMLTDALLSELSKS